MKTFMTALASLALAAGLAAAQGGPQQDQSQPQNQKDQGQQVQPGAPAQTARPGASPSVGTDTQNTYKNGQANQPVPQTRGRGAAGTGVATGFVAAGVGLALLGLFVRRRNRRHPDDPDYDRRSGPPRTGTRL